MKLFARILFGLSLSISFAFPVGVAALRARRQPAAAPLPVVSSPELDANFVSARLVDAIVQIESGGNPLRIGSKGERGLMQIKEDTWREVTASVFGNPLPFDLAFDPDLNRRVGVAYLAFLQRQLLPCQSDWVADERSLLLAAYNAGFGRVRKAGFDVGRLPATARDYVQRAAALHDALLADMAETVRQRLNAPL